MVHTMNHNGANIFMIIREENSPMQRISISFFEETYQIISERAEQKKLSIANYIRNLVELGLKVEDMSSENSSSEEESPIQKDLNILKKLLKKNLIAELESRMLTRYLTLHCSEGSEEDNREALRKAKETSEALVEGMLEE